MVETQPEYTYKPLNNEITIKSIASILSDIINENNNPDNPAKQALKEAQKMTSFFCSRIPTISISSYLERILKYSKMEEATLVIVLIYIDKLCELNNFLLTEYNIHRYFFTLE